MNDMKPKWVVTWVAVVGALGLTLGLFRDQLLPLVGGRVVARAEYEQAEHARRHIFETPIGEPIVVFDDAINGRLTLYVYASDLCIGRVLASPGGSSAASDFMVAMPRPSLPPVAYSDLGVGWLLAEPAFAGDQPCGGCVQHGPPSGEKRERVAECWERVWWGWPEGCVAYAMWNLCSRTFDTNPNGSVRVCWTTCRH